MDSIKKCEYCGRNNTLDVTHCSGCGTQLVLDEQLPPSEPQKKSKAIAVILALIFGPLGLLYLGLEGLIVIFFIVGISFFALPLLLGIMSLKGGMWISIFGRVACAIWALQAVENRNADK